MPESEKKSPERIERLSDLLLSLKEGEQAGLVFLNKKKEQPQSPSPAKPMKRLGDASLEEGDSVVIFTPKKPKPSEPQSPKEPEPPKK